MGGIVVSLYIRSTIAETIVVRLNGRYVAAAFCGERHTNLTSQLSQMQCQFEKLDEKMETNFNSLRSQLAQMEAATHRIANASILRERNVADHLRDTEIKHRT
jgi:hypothetical protein